MTATTSPNRLAQYLDAPQKALPPATPESREALLTDAVFAAVAALQGLLAHEDPRVVMRAAEMILSLETTRQRHGRPVIGMERPEEPLVFAATSGSGILEPHPPAPSPTRRGGERAVNHANPLDGFIEKVRQELQRQEDAEGTGVIVTRAQAAECARYIQANAHNTPLNQPPAGRRCHGERPGNRNLPRSGILAAPPRACP